MKHNADLMYARMNKVVDDSVNHLMFYDLSGIEINPVKRKRKRPDLNSGSIREIQMYGKDMKLQWLRDNHFKYSTKSIAEALNISPSAVSSKLTNLQLRQSTRECAQLKRVGLCCRKKCVHMLSDQELVYYFNASNMSKNEVEKKQVIFEMFVKMKYLSNYPCVKWCLSFGISRSYRQNVIDKINKQKGRTNEVVNGNKGRKSTRRLNNSLIESLDDFILRLREPDSNKKDKDGKTPIVKVQTRTFNKKDEKKDKPKNKAPPKPIKLKTSSYTPSTFKFGKVHSSKFQLTFHNQSPDRFAANHYDYKPEKNDHKQREKPKKHSTSQKKQKVHAHMQSKLTLNKQKSEETIPGTATLDFSTPIYQNTQPQRTYVPQPMPLPLPHIPAPLPIEELPDALPPTSTFQSATQAIPAYMDHEEEEEEDDLEYVPIQAIGSFEHMEDESDDEVKEDEVVASLAPIPSSDLFMHNDDDDDDDFSFDQDEDDDRQTSSQSRGMYDSAIPPVPIPPGMGNLDDDAMQNDDFDFDDHEDNYDSSALNPELPSMSYPMMPPPVAPNAVDLPQAPLMPAPPQMLNPPLPAPHMPLPLSQPPPQPILPSMPVISELPPPTVDYSGELNTRALSHALLPLDASEDHERESTPPISDMGAFKFPNHIKSISHLYKLYRKNLNPEDQVIKETKFRQLLKKRYRNTRIVKASNHSLSNTLTSAQTPKEIKQFKVLPSYASATKAKPLADPPLPPPVLPVPEIELPAYPEPGQLDDDEQTESVQAISATFSSQPGDL